MLWNRWLTLLKVEVARQAVRSGAAGNVGFKGSAQSEEAPVPLAAKQTAVAYTLQPQTISKPVATAAASKPPPLGVRSALTPRFANQRGSLTPPPQVGIISFRTGLAGAKAAGKDANTGVAQHPNEIKVLCFVDQQKIKARVEMYTMNRATNQMIDVFDTLSQENKEAAFDKIAGNFIERVPMDYLAAMAEKFANAPTQREDDAADAGEHAEAEVETGEARREEKPSMRRKAGALEIRRDAALRLQRERVPWSPTSGLAAAEPTFCCACDYLPRFPLLGSKTSNGWVNLAEAARLGLQAQRSQTMKFLLGARAHLIDAELIAKGSWLL